MEYNIQKQSYLYQFKDYIAGSLGGIASVLIGQPFDTIKVRLQSSMDPEFTVGKALKNLIQEEGYAGLYKGSAAPLAGAAFMECVRFGSYSNMKAMLQENYFINNPQQSRILPDIEDYKNTLIAGPLAGTITCFLTSPVEHIRIRVQVSPKNNFKYSGSLSCTKYIYRNYGIRGIYKGLGPCIGRDSFGYLMYFGSYDGVYKILKSIFIKQDQTHQEKQTWNKLCQIIGGGCSGIFYWLSIYPLDTVKSKLQTDSIKNPKLGSTLSILKQMSFKQMFKGIEPCIARAFPANAGVFLVFEETRRIIEEKHFMH